MSKVVIKTGMKSLIQKARKERWGYAYAFIAPIIILFGLFRVYPSIETLAFSFFDVNIISKTYTPVGFENFGKLIEDSSFMLAVRNTFVYAFFIVLVSTAIGMVLASIFNSKMKGAGVFKAVYFAPFITSTVAAAVVWGYLYDPKFGLFNMILRLLSLPPRGWIASSKDALMSIIIFSIWKTVGYNMVLFIAGLQNIPKDFYEAATIDGAGPVTNSSVSPFTSSRLRRSSCSCTIPFFRSRSSIRSSYLRPEDRQTRVPWSCSRYTSRLSRITVSDTRHRWPSSFLYSSSCSRLSNSRRAESGR
jgi:ABC-type polysaccharide transport system permease subunit